MYACTKSKYNSVKIAERYLFGGYVHVTSFRSVMKYLLDVFPWTWKIPVKVSTEHPVFPAGCHCFHLHSHTQCEG